MALGKALAADRSYRRSSDHTASIARDTIEGALPGPRVWSQGMIRYVTRVRLTRSDERSCQSMLATPSREQFCVAWTFSGCGHIDQQFAQSHHSLSAAQEHVIKLLKRIPHGVSIADVYTEELDETGPTRLSRLNERCVCGHPAHPSRFCSCGCSISEIDNGRDASAPHSIVTTSRH